MAIQLSKDVERAIEAAVHSGRFTSLDDAIGEAARLVLRDPAQEGHPVGPVLEGGDSGQDPILELMRNDTELMDELVADAYRQRREETWWELDL
ncbi:MAG: hypothetical protein P4L84_30790 [Isosphaeraceae bacterium]|nr:hypothetical protein [Isosphaeraceae bacterium]